MVKGNQANSIPMDAKAAAAEAGRRKVIIFFIEDITVPFKLHSSCTATFCLSIPDKI